MKLAGKDLLLGKCTYIMGILNITPDSFSDGGRHKTLEAALRHTEQMLSEGADLIDVGGESTRPGHKQISDGEEISRVVPVIAAIKKEFGVPVSIDTYKPAVFQAALDAGCDMLNDIWGLQYDPEMPRLAAASGVPCVLMHNRKSNVYENLIPDVIADLEAVVSIALSHGIKKDAIILDPGIGFAKNYEQNLEVMAHLPEMIKALPYPFLLGTSRKSMIGQALNGACPDSRAIGTAATTAIGILAGCHFVRVHDIKENKEACLMADAIVRR